jgi:uncharacterized protein YkwD
MRILLLSLLLTSCGPVGVLPPGAGSSAPAVGAGDYAGVSAALAAEANRVRVQNGVQRLEVDPTLNRAATEYAAELAVRRVVDHASSTPGRETMTQRITAAGGAWQRAAENLAKVRVPGEQVAPDVIRMWLGSPGHSRNLLDRGMTRTGAGVARDPGGYWYVVQLYTLPPSRD